LLSEREYARERRVKEDPSPLRAGELNRNRSIEDEARTKASKRKKDNFFVLVDKINKGQDDRPKDSQIRRLEIIENLLRPTFNLLKHK